MTEGGGDNRRFFQESMTNHTYTDLGLTWIKETNMKRIFLRHFPALADSIGNENVFNNTWLGGDPTPEDTTEWLDDISTGAGQVYAQHYDKKAKRAQTVPKTACTGVR
jgi:hypothetical protein